jgi:sulfatase maturation enzyme AslB (radical SAM superfamily)
MRPIFENLNGNLKRRTCMLMVTHACNLNCTYCYETHKDNAMMSFDLAKSIIMKEAELVQNDSRFNELEIDFMGGEPLMNFELIKQIVEWLETKPIPVPFVCFATTNGTLLDEERKAWFKKYRNLVWLAASYDGSTEMQRENRGTEERSVDFSFFHEVWPIQGFKLTVSKESLPHLAAGILESQRKGYRLIASLAQGVDWSDVDAELYFEQLRLLAKAYLDDSNLIPINLLTRGLFGLTNPSQHQQRFCGTGVYMITYDIDGRNYGCHMFSPVVLGQERALESSKVEWTCDTIADDARCKECCLKDYCPTCMGFNYCYRDDLAKRDFRWCKMILAEATASCEFQIKVLAARRESLTEDEAQHGQCAIDAYPLLSSFSVRKAEAPFKLCRLS